MQNKNIKLQFQQKMSRRKKGQRRAVRTAPREQNKEGVLLGSPIAFGTEENIYGFNLDYYHTSLFSNNQRSLVEGDWRFISRKAPLIDIGGGLDPDRPWRDSLIKSIERQYGSRSQVTINRDTQYGRDARQLEYSVGSRSFAGVATDYAIPGRVLTFSDQREAITEPFRRPSTQDVQLTITNEIQQKILGEGPFTSLLREAPNGFLVSWANDYDVKFDDQIEDISGSRLLSTYWPERLIRTEHPLRDVYDLFYNPSRDRVWFKRTDFKIYDPLTRKFTADGRVYEPTRDSIYNQFLNQDGSRGQITLDPSDSEVVVLGPVSNRDIKIGNGSTIVAASPVMTPAVHRLWRLSDESGSKNDRFKADTVLYPSAVGAYGSNTLNIGNGNHIVYYDSSFSEIATKKGNSVYLPSFGAFNWSIDWIPGLTGTRIGSSPFEGLDPTWLPPALSKEAGPALISPIPWDRDPIDPKDGINGLKTDRSYAERMAAFALNPQRGNLDNQQNYLYSIFSKRGGRFGGKSILKTYLNLKQDTSRDDAWVSRNPVNNLGGVKIQAGALNRSKGSENYLKPTGDKVFFGMDWELWQHLLPTAGSTIATQPAGIGGQKRPAQLAWNTVTMAGGRGSNTFNLGNVMDNITNNGLFYNGRASYLLSLTHDDIYSREEILEQGMKFGNAFNEASDDESPYLSTVNLNLQADTTSYSLMIEAADPGAAGPKDLSKVSAWLGVLGLAQKGIKTPLDLNKDYVDNWKAEKTVTTQRIVDEVVWDDLLDKAVQKRKVIDEITKIPKPAKWLERSLFLRRLVGTAFPYVDLATSIFSTAKGLFELFTAKSPEPPREELNSVFIEAGLQPANKAVVINDWHPNAHINLNLPALKPSFWNSLNISIQRPFVTASDSRKDGAFLQVSRTTTTPDKPGVSVSTDWPLVVLQNLDKKDRVEDLQVNDGAFAYYTYSFVDPDAGADLKRKQFNPIRSSSLRLFARLADPSKLLDDKGVPLRSNTLPDDFIYKSSNGFDMRYDAENFAANQRALENPSAGSAAYRYSRYYFDEAFAGKNGLPPDFNEAQRIRRFTSNVSLEFDSRVHGWYWQPVFKSDYQGQFDLENPDPFSQDIDSERSKLWVNHPTKGWKDYSFSELDYNIRAHRYSRLASTFYTSSTDDNKNGISDGLEEIDRRRQFDAQLKLLQSYGDSLYDIDQRLISRDANLFSLTQIQGIESFSVLDFDGAKLNDALVVAFDSISETGESVGYHLILHKVDGRPQRALLADQNMSPISATDFSFNYLVDRDDINRPYDPSQDNAKNPLVRSFGGFYNKSTNTTKLFEYVPFPRTKDGITGLTFEEAEAAARARQLPAALSAEAGISGRLATIDSRKDNDVITGLFQGRAWVGADNQGKQDAYPVKTNFWQWLQGPKKGSQFWSTQSPFFDPEITPLNDGPVNDAFSNWPTGRNGKPQYVPSRRVVSVDGGTGLWYQSSPDNFNPMITGYVAEYERFSGLPSFA